MKIYLENGRSFIAKVHYGMDECCIDRMDEYKRWHHISWNEPTTSVTITEFFEDGRPNSTIVGTGWTSCNYKDVPNKKVGRKIAYDYAVDSLLNNHVINTQEAEIMKTFDANEFEVYLDHDAVKYKKIEAECKAADVIRKAAEMTKKYAKYKTKCSECTDTCKE